MELELKHLGFAGSNRPSAIINLIISSNGTTMETDVTDSDGMVDFDLIYSLEVILDELKEQNRLVDEKFKKK